MQHKTTGLRLAPEVLALVDAAVADGRYPGKSAAVEAAVNGYFGERDAVPAPEAEVPVPERRPPWELVQPGPIPYTVLWQPPDNLDDAHARWHAAHAKGYATEVLPTGADEWIPLAEFGYGQLREAYHAWRDNGMRVRIIATNDAAYTRFVA